MTRSIKKSIADYQKRFITHEKNNRGGAFYASDMQQLHDMSGSEWDLINNALQAGFMIGYRHAKREQRARSRDTISR